MRMALKYKWCFCALITACLLLTGLPLRAEELGVVTGSIVNIRKEPGTSNPILAKVKKGESFLVLAKSGDWVKIRLNNGQEGWISGSYLSISQISGKKVVAKDNGINLRKGPGTNYAALSKVQAGTVLTVLETRNNWHKVLTSAGVQAWIAGWLVTETTSSIPGTPGDNPVPTVPPPVPADSVSGLQPLPQSTLLVVTGDIVNIRSAGNMEAQVLTKVSRGTKLPALGKAGDWYQVQLSNGTLGWIAGWLTEAGEGSTPSRSSGAEVLSAPLAQDLIFRILDVAGKPCLVLEGCSQEEYRLTVHKNDNTLNLEVDQATEINYEGQLARLGINRLKIAPQGGKAQINLAFANIPAESVTYDANSLTSYITVGTDLSKGLAGKIIVLDPGHSGFQSAGLLDPGAIGPRTKLQERDVTLGISLKLKGLLESAGAKVIMTHSNSTYLSLTERAAVANNSGAHIFVSIHANSSVKKELWGHTTYFYAPSGDELLGSQRYSRQKLASLVQREMVKAAGRLDNGLKESSFAVLRETRVPSILVETAFISHREEEILLGQNSFRQKLAEGIFRGIEAYFNE